MYVKAKVNQQIHIIPWLEQVVGYTVYFICVGIVELWSTRSKQNYKIKKSCPQWDSNPVPSAKGADALTIVLYIRLDGKYFKVNFNAHMYS